MGEAVSSTLTGDYEIAVLRHGRSKKRWFFLLFNLRAEKNVKKSKRCVIILWLMYLFFFKYSYMHSYIIFINFIIRCSRRTIDLSSVCTLNLWNINSTKRFDVYVLWMFPWIQGSYPPGQLNWDLKEDIDISYTDIYTAHAFHVVVYFIWNVQAQIDNKIIKCNNY